MSPSTLLVAAALLTGPQEFLQSADPAPAADPPVVSRPPAVSRPRRSQPVSNQPVRSHGDRQPALDSRAPADSQFRVNRQLPPVDNQLEATRAAQAGQAVVDAAVVIAKQDLMIPARDAGPLASVAIAEGDTVQSGQVIGQLDDSELWVQRKAKSLELDQATEQANSTVQINAAVAIADAAKVELAESEEINEDEPGAIAASQVRRLQVQVERADAQAEVAREEKKLAQIQREIRAAELEAAELAIERREIRSTIDGRVMQLLRRPGEWMQPGDPLARIVRLDVLHVEGWVRAEAVLPDQIIRGQHANVTVLRGPGDNEILDGEVAYVIPLIDSDNAYRVVVEINNTPNPATGAWRVYPGMRVQMTIDLDSASGRPLPGGEPLPGVGPLPDVTP